MTPHDEHSRNPENSTNEVVSASVGVDEGADLANDGLDEVIADIVHEKAAEDKKNASGQSGKVQTATKKDEDTANQRKVLREQLLQVAPRERVMRREIMRELELKKTQLEAEIRVYNRNREYDLLSAAMAQLRAVIRQIEIVARVGYETLKEIWLKVVHKFA